MGYLSLGNRRTVSALDSTGRNTGNWTTAITSDVLNISVGTFELYHAVVEDVLPGAAAVIQIGIRTFSYTAPQGGSEWDPVNPPLMRPGQDLYFLWDTAASVGTAPIVTTWWRYDPLLLGNR